MERIVDNAVTRAFDDNPEYQAMIAQIRKNAEDLKVALAALDAVYHSPAFAHLPGDVKTQVIDAANLIDPDAESETTAEGGQG